MRITRTVFVVAVGLFSLLPFASVALALCSGDCTVDLATQAKVVEKYAKKRWSAISTCAKKGSPSCPEPCPVPGGTAQPFGLATSCAALIACEMDSLAAVVYQGTWDEVGFCPLTPATACGNSRSKGAGRLVGKKLKRRRTSKMDKFSRDRDKCVRKVDAKASCGGDALCNRAGGWVDELFPLSLGKNGYQMLPFAIPSDGEGIATLTLSAESADWGDIGRESVVVEYDVDGAVIGSIVVYNGSVPTAYQVMLGPLTAGNHTIGLRHKSRLSPAFDSPVTIDQAAVVEAIVAGDPRFDLVRFSPILLGIDTKLNPAPLAGRFHKGNAVSDVPLIVYARPNPQVGFTTYSYTMIWSNEDGGTGSWPSLLMAQWGRTTDIEGIVEVDVADDGSLLAVRYRPDESGALADFAGAFVAGTHPLVRTRTANGLIADDGDSTLRFAIAPVEYDDTGLSRATGMELNPVSHRITAKEMAREGKTEPVANAATETLSDLRNYLFVDYDISTDSSGRVLRAVAVVGGSAYASDHFSTTFNPALVPRLTSGVSRGAIELPPGTTVADIQEFGMEGIGTMSGTLHSLDAFMLDSDFLPGPHISFSGAVAASGTNPQWMVVP